MSTLTAAYVQFRPLFGDLAGNRQRLAALLETVRGADLVVLPELAFSGYNFEDREQALTLAEPASPQAESVRMLTQRANDIGATLVAGYCELEAGTLYNSAVVVRPRDGLVATHRKMHLFDREKYIFEPGERFTTLDIPLRSGGSAKLGVLVCFDWAFPESWRVLMLAGVDVVAHPSNLVIPGFCQSCLPAMARMNRLGVVLANRYGEERRLHFTGESLILDGLGKELHRGPVEGDHVGRATLELTTIRNKQLTPNNHLLADRRPELYTPLCEPNEEVPSQPRNVGLGDTLRDLRHGG